jgi:hypothetical protein
MSDLEFDARLGRLFSQPPAFGDADGFARRVEDRLGRSWAVRRMLIGLAGVVGGVIAAGQMLGGGHLWDAASTLTAQVTGAVTRGGQAMGQSRVLGDLPIGGEVLWMGLGLAALAVVLVAARAFEVI